MQNKTKPNCIENQTFNMIILTQNKDVSFKDSSREEVSGHNVLKLCLKVMLKSRPFRRLLMIFVYVELDDKVAL